MCTTEGRCACAPGFTACGPKACVDLGTDHHHCGYCDIKCKGAGACIEGVCGGATPKKDPPFEIDGANAAQTCQINQEGYPERPLYQPGPGSAQEFLPFADELDDPSGERFNWASGPTGWNTPYYRNLTSAPYFAYGDAWAATNGYQAGGLEYVSSILSSSTASCIGVAATTAATMTSGPQAWQYPLACATPDRPHVQDGPSIHYDASGSSFWAVAHEKDMNGLGPTWLYVFPPNCIGRPGSGTCPGLPAVDVDDNAGDHATVTVNPCTHHGIVAYRNGNHVQLKFYDTTATQVGATWIIDLNAQFGATSECFNTGGFVPRCGNLGTVDCSSLGASGCARLADKVHVATKRVTVGRTINCYAYVAYDSLFEDVDGYARMRANLKVANITSETGVTIVNTLQAPSSFQARYSNFGSIATAAEFGSGAGWFYYSQGNFFNMSDPCATQYVGQTNTNNGLSGTWTLQTLDSGFPTLQVGGADYVGIIKRGLPGGTLFPTWHRAVPFSGSGNCISCSAAGGQYSLAIYGSQVTP